MGRPPKYNWDEIQNAYECGKSVDDLVILYGVSKKTLQNRISRELWEVTGSIVNDIDSVKGSLGKITGTILDNPEKAIIIADDILSIINETISKIDAEAIVFNATKLSLIRKTEMLSSNLKQLHIKSRTVNKEEGTFQESIDIIDVPLTPSDFKFIDDGIDKNSITLGVNQRHASSTINNNNTNAVQFKRVSIVRRGD